MSRPVAATGSTSGALREPAALPGWIVTTTRNECLRVLRIRQRTGTFDPLLEPPRTRGPAEEPSQIDEDLMRDERHDALLTAFAELSGRHRELLTLLLADPPVSYADISQRLGSRWRHRTTRGAGPAKAPTQFGPGRAAERREHR